MSLQRESIIYTRQTIMVDESVELRQSQNIANSLRRIRQLIAISVRCIESSSGTIGHELRLAEVNLRRLSPHISIETYRKLLDAIEGLMLINMSSGNQQVQTYSAPRRSLQGN